MPVIVRLDVMLALRKVRSKELAADIGMTEANLSLLKSGKVKGIRFSTLEAICQALDCQPGDILVDGQGFDKPRTDVGIVFQKPTLVDWRTVYGNVMLQAQLRGLDNVEHRERARVLLAAVGLQDFHGYSMQGVHIVVA